MIRFFCNNCDIRFGQDATDTSWITILTYSGIRKFPDAQSVHELHLCPECFKTLFPKLTAR